MYVKVCIIVILLYVYDIPVLDMQCEDPSLCHAYKMMSCPTHKHDAMLHLKVLSSSGKLNFTTQMKYLNINRCDLY